MKNCQCCEEPKENPLGLCSNCGRFPVTPKEEVDDVDLESALGVAFLKLDEEDRISLYNFRLGVLFGAAWQKERSYTIEEIKDALKQWTEQCTSGLSPRFTEYLLSGEWKNLKK